MNSSLSRIVTLARHEYRAAARSRVLIVLLGILITITAVSVYIASVDYSSQLADYTAYLAAANARGVTPTAPSPLQLLALLRGSLEYVEIIGAILGITLGYLSVARERSNRTLALLRSRPVTPGELAAGSALGALSVIATVIAATAAVAILSLGIIGNDWINSSQFVKLFLTYLASIVYIGSFYCLGAITTARSRVAVNGLTLALGIWLVVVLVIPQIGDTLDADNQVPGGLFSALTLNKPQETKVLSHFGAYEAVRTGIEETSFAKHYERFTFAMTDVKDKYRGFSLWRLFGEKRNDIGWLILYSLLLGFALFRSFRRQPTIPQGGQP